MGYVIVYLPNLIVRPTCRHYAPVLLGPKGRRTKKMGGGPMGSGREVVAPPTGGIFIDVTCANGAGHVLREPSAKYDLEM